MTEREKADSEMMARIFAVQTGVLALIQALPQNPAITALLRGEADRMRAILLARPIADSAIDAFDSQIRVILKAAEKSHPPLG